MYVSYAGACMILKLFVRRERERERETDRQTDRQNQKGVEKVIFHLAVGYLLLMSVWYAADYCILLILTPPLLCLQMRDINCPNLTRLIGVCPETNNVSILTEYCSRGSLQVINSLSLSLTHAHARTHARRDHFTTKTTFTINAIFLIHQSVLYHVMLTWGKSPLVICERRESRIGCHQPILLAKVKMSVGILSVWSGHFRFVD